VGRAVGALETYFPVLHRRMRGFGYAASTENHGDIPQSLHRVTVYQSQTNTFQPVHGSDYVYDL
jgi:hypothetical protein